jgi:hypothetical protein
MPASSKDYSVVLRLNKTQYDKILEFQQGYESLFGKYTSIEELLSNNTISNTSLGKKLNTTTKKRKISVKTVHSSQAKLGVFD